MNQLKCDILIIGSGAAGGVLAATLAERTQQDILLIEKGGFFTKESFNQRELDMGMLYAGGGSRSTSDGAIPVRGGECVGGGTTVNLALCFDPIPAVWDRWRESSGLQGFSFDDAASDYGQTGLNMRGCLAEVRQRLNVHAVAAEQINDNNRLLERGCRQLGIATKRFELNMRDCRQCGYCAQGCAYDHKQGTMVTYIADALNRGVRLLHHCDVDKIRFQRRGEKQVATGAVGIIHPTRAGSQANLVPPGPVEIAARLVIVAAGAIETPCLLQRSGHPDPHGRIGRGLVLHPSLPVIGVFDRQLTNYRGITGSVYSDHYFSTQGFYFECLFGHPVYGASIMPGFGPAHFEMMRLYNRMAGFGVMLVDRVQTDNRVAYDAATRRPMVHYQLPQRDKPRLRFAAQKAVEIMFAAGTKATQAVHCQHLEFLPHQTTITSAHPQATVKMGADVRRSVVNSRCESHQVESLMVCDSSVFPTSCGANPMISIMTLARYQGKRIAAEWDRYGR